ncbi:ABC transporter substrate-binding protein [Fictibacillus phosphorivorans]|uniref:ABC transporter substrate-binding protein n=1 Tax=Fictibacillus phosphorivorans TaxID=1221500 RepID=A0A165P6Z9_9BACL|nr:ABC transporter substrate-binding protein [Fictibacillus phosphorivorans]KZE69195.1 ABC transporter substrate-binding protein [Fictibacillus phosphorivorans]
MKKWFTWALMAVLIISLFSGCSGSDEKKAEAKKTKDGKVVVDFWTFWGSETRRPIIEKIIDDYNASQDKVFVKHTFLPWGDIWTKNLAAIAAGNPPDVIINDINAVGHRAKNDQAENLSKYIKDDSFKENFYPELWKTVEYKGDPYAVPFNTDTRLLFYNKTAFKEAGLDPNKPPQTWEELESYAEKLDKKSGKKYDRIGFYPLWGSFGADSWMMNADNGQSYIDENGDVKIATKEKVKALNWIKGYNDRIGVEQVNAFKADFGSEQSNPFIAGKVAMMVDVATFYTQIRDYGKDMEFGVAPVPAVSEGEKNWSAGGGFVAEIPKGSNSPKEAYDFIKYLTGTEAQTYWAAQNFDNVANKEAAEKALSELKGTDKEVYQAAVDNMEVTKLFPVPVDAPDYQSKINPMIDAVLLGQRKASDALKDAQKSVEGSIQK